MGHGDLLERWVAGGKQYPQKMAELPFYGVFLFKIRYSWECESHAWKGFEKLAVLATSILAFFFFFFNFKKRAFMEAMLLGGLDVSKQQPRKI